MVLRTTTNSSWNLKLSIKPEAEAEQWIQAKHKCGYPHKKLHLEIQTSVPPKPPGEVLSRPGQKQPREYNNIPAENPTTQSDLQQH